MNFGDYNTRRWQLIEWGTQIKGLLTDNGDDHAVSEINEAISRLQKDQIVITVLGKAKRGKSTLINAFLGRNDDLLAPIDKLPASSVISRFMYSDEEKAVVFFRSGKTLNISYSDIKQYVTEENNPENKKEVAFVDVYGTFQNLESGVILIDTPGAGSIHEHHDQLIYDVIPNSNVIIFLATAQMPIDQDELDLLKRIADADKEKIFFVLNKIDIVPQNEIENAIMHNEQVLRENTPFADVTMKYQISALKAFQGHKNESAIDTLLQDIDKLLKDGKEKIISASFVSSVNEATRGLQQKLSVEINNATKTTEELEADLNKLQREKIEITRNREGVEKKFLLNWNKNIEKFESVLTAKQEEVKRRFTQMLDDTSNLNLKQFKKNLPEKLKSLIDNELRDPSLQLENDLRETLISFQTDLPAIDLEAFCGQISFNSDNAFLKTAIGGTATAALGTSLAMIAASAVTVTSTSLASAGGLGTILAPTLGGTIGSLFGGAGAAATGTAIASSLFAPPVAATTIATPVLWATVLGPVGWTVAGLGALAIPVSWFCAKNKDRNKIVEAGTQYIEKTIVFFRKERIPAIRKISGYIIGNIQEKQESQIQQIEESIRTFIATKPSSEQTEKMRYNLRKLNSLLAEQQDHLSTCNK